MTPAEKREMVAHVRAAWRISIRRACRAGRSAKRYHSKWATETRVRHGHKNLTAATAHTKFVLQPALWANYGLGTRHNIRQARDAQNRHPIGTRTRGSDVRHIDPIPQLG